MFNNDYFKNICVLVHEKGYKKSRFDKDFILWGKLLQKRIDGFKRKTKTEFKSYDTVIIGEYPIYRMNKELYATIQATYTLLHDKAFLDYHIEYMEQEKYEERDYLRNHILRAQVQISKELKTFGKEVRKSGYTFDLEPIYKLA